MSISNASHYAATIGFFDGVHCGHQALISQLRHEASQRGLRSMVVTFDHHPRQVLHPHWQPLLLSSVAEKRQLLLSTGIDRLEVLHFDHSLAAMDARTFMSSVLASQLGVCLLLTGYDNHFGHRTPASAANDSTHSEGFADYVRYGSAAGITVVGGSPSSASDGVVVSSSRIRQALSAGHVSDAARWLGRPYVLSGRVVHGEQVGRRLGFATANIEPSEALKMIPADGVYAVWACIGTDSKVLPAMMNIGRRPTFDGQRQTLEVHLIDFAADLYGQVLTVFFAERLRDEQAFSSAESLARQMVADRQQALSLLSAVHVPSPNLPPL